MRFSVPGARSLTPADRSRTCVHAGLARSPDNLRERRWSFNRDFFGWTVNQWQAWARGEFDVTDDDAQTTWAVRCANVGEFWVDNKRFAGDWYGYGERWSRLVLSPGRHTVRVRLASEVRLFGGALPPSLTFVLEFRAVADVLPLQNGRIVPELINGSLASSPLSLTLFNGAAVQAVASGVAVNDSRVRASVPVRAVPRACQAVSNRGHSRGSWHARVPSPRSRCRPTPLQFAATLSTPTATWASGQSGPVNLELTTTAGPATGVLPTLSF